MESGIYRIVCTANGRIYIGSALRFKTRWKIHRSQLNLGCHHSIHLQRCWDKYGGTVFRFEVIELVPSPEMLVQREQHYIDTLQPEFNSCPKAGSSLGFRHASETKVRMSLVRMGTPSPRKGAKHTVEAKEKMSAAAKLRPPPFVGRKHTQEAKEKMATRKSAAPSRSRSVEQWTLEGMFVARYPTLKAAQRATGVTVENIRNVLTGRAKKAGGFSWCDPVPAA